MTVTTAAEAIADEPDDAGPSEAVGAYQPGIDGMRAVAVLLILAYHSPFSWAKGGFLGVSQFFTLSGFLITSILLRRNAAGGIDLGNFWTRRLRRLMPAAIACLVGVMVFGATVADRQQADGLPMQVFAAATYWVNWLFIIQKTSYVGLFASPSPVQHFWSLAIEEQFYVLMPLGLFVLLRRTRSRNVLLAVIGGVALASTAWMAFLHGSGASFDRVYYGTDTRMAEMLVGAVLAVVMFHRRVWFTDRAKQVLAVLSTVALAASLWAASSVPLTESALWSGGLFVYSLVTVVITLGVLAGRGPAARLLALRPLPDIGRISYGLYLYHWPIFLWLTPARTDLAIAPLFALRTAATFLVAIASYHLIEKPIRDGGKVLTRGSLRYAVAPLAVLLVVGGTYATVDRAATDPLETLRADDSSLTPPVQPTDGVLDMLVITDEKGPGVVDRIQHIAGQGTTMRVTRAPFSCDAVTTDAKPTCTNWKATWPGLVADHDPDVVLFYVDDWPAADIARVSKLPPLASVPFAEKVLGNGFDLLTAKGARIVFASSGADFGIQITRSQQPFHIAMADLEASRTDIRHVLGGRLPDPLKVPRADFVEKSAQALITDASLYQRTGASKLTKVLVVGDSQARSLGYGLERWGAQAGQALVWNVSAEGCGITQRGQTRSGDVTTPVPQQCRDAAAAWPKQVAEFDPDVVVVLSSIWDLRSRQVLGWDRFYGPGDPTFDTFLVKEYAAAVDTFSKGGAKVVWLTAPCIENDPATSGAVGEANKVNIAHLDQTVLPQLARQRPDQVRLFDLDAVLCPGGSYVRAIDGIDPVRSDGTHFSVDGSLWFAHTYGPKILQLAKG